MSQAKDFTEALRRLQYAADQPQDGMPSAVRRVLKADLDMILEDWHTLDTRIRAPFTPTATGLGESRLLASPAVPEGYIVVSDERGHVVFAGPIPQLPREPGWGAATTMNVHPNTMLLMASLEKQS